MTQELLIPSILALWYVGVLLVGLSVGWRCRGGQTPFPDFPNPFRKKPEPPTAPKPNKPQEPV